MIGKTKKNSVSEGSMGLSQFGANTMRASDLRAYSYFFLDQDCDQVYLRTSRSDGPLPSEKCDPNISQLDVWDRHIL